MKTRLILAASLSAALLSPALASACSAPEQPELPDPDTAVLAEMVKAQKDVKKFIAAGNDYLGCEKNTKKYNDMVDLMKSVGADFNARIAAFKAKQK